MAIDKKGVNIETPFPESRAHRDAVIRLKEELRKREPEEIARRSGAPYREEGEGKGYFQMILFGEKIIVTYPEFDVLEADTENRASERFCAIVLHYLHKAEGSPEEGRWVSLAELPDGQFYRQAYQGYSGNRLMKIFGNDLGRFEKAATAAGGEKEEIGDASYSFRVLPRIPLLAVYWRGDEEFGPSCQILFDASVSHYLLTDMCAFLGSVLADRILLKA
ncbi:MAG: DUF3786 domain-containing protein [Spirochaetota bacterium]